MMTIKESVCNALIEKLKQVKPTDGEVAMTKDEITALDGNAKITSELINEVASIRHEDKDTSISVFTSIKWDNDVLTARFNKVAIPHLLK